MSRPAKLSRSARLGACMALALACLAPLAATAEAVYEPVSSGSTRLLLDKSLLRSLQSEGVTLSARAPAELHGSTVSFPVVGGKFDPTTGKGEVDHEGALLFRAGGRSIPLKALQLKTSRKRTPLAAKVGGSQLKLATVGGLKVARAGFASKISVSSLALSAKLAVRLAKKLGRRGFFEPGMALGRTVTKVNPEAIALQHRGKAELAFAPGFRAKLDSLFVAVNPIFPAEHPGPFTLPLLAGAISPAANLGTIETEGSLEFLQLGGGQVFWRELWIDLAAMTFSSESEVLPSPPYAGKGERAPVASLVPASTAANPKERTVYSAGTLRLDPATAGTFNEVFAKSLGKGEVFVAGEEVGSLAFTAQGQ